MLESSTDSSRKGSILLKLDVRTKVVLCLLVAIVTLLLSTVNALLPLFVISFCYVLLMRRIKVIIVSYLFMTLVMFLSFGFVIGLEQIVPSLKASIKYSSVLTPFLRGAIAMNIILPIGFTIRMPNMLSALQSMHLPFVVYLPSTVMVRFIPSFTADVKQIYEALKIKGISLNLKNIICHPYIILRTFIFPLVYMALRTSDDLGISADMKGVGNGAHTPFRSDKMQSYDYLVCFIGFALCFGALIIEYLSDGTFKAGIH